MKGKHQIDGILLHMQSGRHNINPEFLAMMELSKHIYCISVSHTFINYNVSDMQGVIQVHINMVNIDQLDQD